MLTFREGGERVGRGWGEGGERVGRGWGEGGERVGRGWGEGGEGARMIRTVFLFDPCDVVT